MQGPRRFALRLTIGGPACLLAVLGTSLAAAQTTSPEDIASARLLGTEGFRLADLGDCVGAVLKLEAAEKLFHAPTTLERLGECQIKTGKFVAGTESLNRVVREALLPNAPGAFLAARDRAQRELSGALAHIARLRIHVEGAPSDKVTVTVDGANVPSALFDGDRPTDPGPHEVKATATGYKAATASVKLDDGGGASVSLTLEPDPTVSAAPAAPAGGSTISPPGPTPPPLPSAADGSGTRRGVGIGVLAVGGAGIVVGSVFGILALKTRSTLNGECGASKMDCPGAAESDISALSTRATVSTIGFAVGIAGVGVGTFLLATSFGGEKATSGGTAARSSTLPLAGIRLQPWLALGSAGVNGTFE